MFRVLFLIQHVCMRSHSRACLCVDFQGEAPKQPLVRSKDRSDQPPDEKDLYDNFCKTAIKSSIFASRVMSLKSALSSDEGSYSMMREGSGIDRSDLVGIHSADHSAGDGFSRAGSVGSNVKSARCVGDHTSWPVKRLADPCNF